MLYGIYTILDSKSGYIGLSLDHSDQTATRNFQLAIRQPGTLMNQFPEDYRLFKVGEFDTESGQLDPYLKPEFVYQGVKSSETD